MDKVRLTVTEYDALVRKLSTHAMIDNQTTELVAAHKLGMQHVLNVLRAGWVIEDTTQEVSVEVQSKQKETKTWRQYLARGLAVILRRNK